MSDAASQFVEIGMAYMRRHPESRHEIASGLLSLAWAKRSAAA
jgi:hypothetical protein